MRNIKFRAWWENQLRYNAIAGNGQCLFIPNATGEYKQINLAECKIMQSTGYEDVRGIEIYEDDIVSMKSYNYHFLNSHLFRVVYETKDMQFKLLDIETKNVYSVVGFFDLQIVGNIYEGSELLGRSVKADA